MTAFMGRRTVWIAALLLTLNASQLQGYSVLAHEASIDVCWDDGIRPLLQRRFPRATADELMEARAYAYGGSVIQDLGYYPFGSKFFSNLLHYVRSGDFVEALVDLARTPNELAFAVGALAHYANDNTGHPEAVNRAVPIIFPKLGAKYGDTVTYVQAPKEHVIVEFSFDIVQAAAGVFPPDAYRQFIGFRVEKPLLQRAFRDTYGLDLEDVFADEDRAIGSYRYAVSQIFPALTEAAWRDKHDEIVKLFPSVERSGFVLRYSRAAFEGDFGSDYQRPGWFARVLGLLYRILPKIGPLKPLSFKAPTPEAEAFFARSFKDATSRFRATLDAAGRDRLDLKNTDFDTGQPSRHGEYALADDTYAELLERWVDRNFEGVPSAMSRNALAFYGSDPAPASPRDRKHWRTTSAALATLRQLTQTPGL